MKRELTAAAPVYRYDGPLRTDAGEYPTGSPSGHHFSSYQGEWFTPHDDRIRGVDAQIGVLKLNNGRWLGHPCHGFATYNEQFGSRSAALRASIAQVIGNMRYWLRNNEGWSCGAVPAWRAEAVIGWARRLAPPRPFVLSIWRVPA